MQHKQVFAEFRLELCGSRGGRLGPASITVRTASVDIKQQHQTKKKKKKKMKKKKLFCFESELFSAQPYLLFAKETKKKLARDEINRHLCHSCRPRHDVADTEQLRSWRAVFSRL